VYRRPGYAVPMRIRVTFGRGERLRYISHLDILRAWERTLRRAGLPLAYSQGFTPHPKLAFASPLPLGFLAEAEIMDVTLDERVPLDEFRQRLAAQTTTGMPVLAVEEVPPSAPAPQSVLLWADYRVELPTVDTGAARAVVEAFLAETSHPFVDDRRERPKAFDLRAAVARLTAGSRSSGEGTVLEMRLQADAETTARPEHVVTALFPGAEPSLIVRTGLVLNEPSPARDAWRRTGRYA